MTVCGGWSLVKHDVTGTKAITLWCRSWTCADCAPYRVADLKRQAVDGKPTSFITLTVNPRLGQSPEERAQELSDAWKIVVKRARRKWTKAPLEYFAVFEETKKGEPHLHIMARAPFIPQRWLSAVMDELISAPIVDIRKVGRVANAAKYVAKYVAKGPKPFSKLKRYWASSGYAQEWRSRASKKGDRDSGWRVWKEPLIVLADIFRALAYQVEFQGDHELHVFMRGPPWQKA